MIASRWQDIHPSQEIVPHIFDVFRLLAHTNIFRSVPHALLVLCDHLFLTISLYLFGERLTG